MATLTRRGTGITQTGWTNPTNAYDAGTATFASWASTVANQTNTVYITGYDFAGAGLPSTAGLNSVQFTVKQYVSATNRMNAPTVRAYKGATALGTTTTLTNSNQTSNTQTVTITGLTIADLNDSTFQVQFVATHYNGTISGTQFLDYIDVVVDYTPVAAPTSRTLTASSASATSVLLSWNTDTGAFPVPTYSVEQSTNGTTFSTVASGLSGTSYTVTGLTTGVLYYFRVVGTNSQGSATSNTATATPTEWALENTLEGGTDETSIPASPSLSGPDPFNLFYSNTAAVYDTAVAKGGTVSMRTQHTTGTTGSSMAGWTFTASTRLPFYTRFYLYVTANPSAATTIVRIGNSSDSQIAFLRLNTNGTLAFGTGTPTNTTNAISLSQWVRIELAITSTSATVRLYNVTESTTVTEEVTQSTSFAAVGTIRYGVNAITNAGPFWWDSLKTGESWIGPESPAGNTVSRTATGSGTGTQSANRLITDIRTATGSGTGTETASKLLTGIRTATGSGTGTQAATSFATRLRTATGTGAGTQTAARVITVLRTASNSGTGTEASSRLVTRARTATGAGTGTQTAVGARVGLTVSRTASGSGAGTESATGALTTAVVRTATNAAASDNNAKLTLGTATGRGVRALDSSLFDPVGDFSLVARVSAPDWTPAAISTIIGKWDTNLGQRSYRMQLGTTGLLRLSVSEAGSAETLVVSTANVSTLTANQPYWFKIDVDVDNGSGGFTTRFYWAEDSPLEPQRWNQLGADVATSTIGTLGLFYSTATMWIGNSTNVTNPWTGDLYRAIGRDTNGTMFDWNPTVPSNTFTDINGSVFTVQGAGNTWTDASAPSSTATRLISRPRTATGSGAGTETATPSITAVTMVGYWGIRAF